MPLEELVMTEPRLGPDALRYLEPGAAVQRRTSPGGAGPEPVAAQLEPRVPASRRRRPGWRDETAGTPAPLVRA